MMPLTLHQLAPSRTAADLSVSEPIYDFGKHVFPALLGRLSCLHLPEDHLLWGVQYDGEWFDVGQKRDYIKVNGYLLDGHFHIDLPYERFAWGYLGDHVQIDFEEVTIRPPVILGHNCVIEPGAVLGPYAVIGDGWIIEGQARVSHSVLWQHYSFFDESGNEVPAHQRSLVDPHVLERDVSIDGCIVVGGAIRQNLRDQTVTIGRKGSLAITPIDYVPPAERA